MPKYRITSPDGKTYEVTAPEGATQEQVLAYAQQHSQQPSPKPAPAKPSAGNGGDIAALVSGKRKPTMYEDFRRTVGMMPHGKLAAASLDFMDAAQHNTMSALHGTAQLVEHSLGLPQAAHDDRVLRQREANYQRRNADSGASYAGAAVGQILPWMYGMGELRAAGLLPTVTATGFKGLAQKSGLLALEGGLMGAAQPVLSDDYAGTKAAQVGIGALAAPVLAGTTTAAMRGARYLTPSGREAIANERLAKIYGSDPEALAKLRNGTDVDGFDLTPGQAIGTPKAVQAERGLRNDPRTAPAFAERESMNNAAARDQVARVAKDEDALAAAREARTNNSNAYRNQHLPEQGSAMVDAAPVFAQLERLSLSANPVIRGAAREHLSLLKKQAVEGKVPAYALDDIRQNAGAMIAKHTPVGGGSSKEAAQYGSVTNQIADTLERAVPGYRNYLATYARDSQPVNDMQAARLLLDAIDSGGRDAGNHQSVSLNQLKAMLAKDNRANFPMSPQARKEIEAVLEALQRRSVTNNPIAASGSNTAADVQLALRASPWLMRLIGHVASAGGGMVGSGAGPAGALGGYAAGAALVEGINAANNNVVTRMGTKAASAKATAAAIEAERQRQLSRGLDNLLLPYNSRTLPPPR